MISHPWVCLPHHAHSKPGFCKVLSTSRGIGHLQARAVEYLGGTPLGCGGGGLGTELKMLLDWSENGHW